MLEARLPILAGLLLPCALLLTSTTARAEVLEGTVSKSGSSAMRLARPVSSHLPGVSSAPVPAPPIRISRRGPEFKKDQGLVDPSQFSTPLNGSARSDDAQLKTDFSSPGKFDMGAERNIRELRLAWEQWHKQLSRAIYRRWQDVADEPGKATLRVVVTKNRDIEVQVLHSEASRHFDRQLVGVIRSLEGNPGLTFPSKSQRQQVSFEADYVAGTNVTPGYSWVKNDYETIEESN